MFRKIRQRGFLPVFQSFGSSPLEHWEMIIGSSGCVRRVTDDQVRVLVLELSSPNVSTCYLRCPREPRASLGIYNNYLFMIVKSLNKYFTFEITVLDDRNQHRRLRMSNFEKRTRVHHFGASMPLCLKSGWNEICFDLAEFTRKAYNTNYMETTRIQIHANCRIRVIYFCDRIYEDKEIPQKLKIFLPIATPCRKKSEPEESAPQKEPENVIITDYCQEYQAEGGGEEMYPYEPSVKSLEKEVHETTRKASVTESLASMLASFQHDEDEDYGHYNYDNVDEVQHAAAEPEHEDAAEESEEKPEERETEHEDEAKKSEVMQVDEAAEDMEDAVEEA